MGLILELPQGIDTFQDWNSSEDIAAMVAAVAADWFEHQKRQKPLFKEASMPGTIGFLPSATRAMEFLKEVGP